MLIVRHKVTGAMYRATQGTEFSDTWYSCYPVDRSGPGFAIALAPYDVDIVGEAEK